MQDNQWTPLPGDQNGNRTRREGGDAKEERDNVIIKLQNDRNKGMYFWIGRSDPIGQILLEYCHREGLTYETQRFIFDGARVKESHTPKDLAMENGDVIDVCTDQTGGGY